jgi:Zn-dependent protease with chaperone function
MAPFLRSALRLRVWPSNGKWLLLDCPARHSCWRGRILYRTSDSDRGAARQNDSCRCSTDRKRIPTNLGFHETSGRTVGARHPDNIVVGFTPNFFVTEATVDCISGTLEGVTMHLSLPLCRILGIQELSAVIFHELSHFKGEDAKFTIHFYPIYRGISDSLYGVSNASAQIANIGSYIPIAAFKVMFLVASLFLFPSIYLLRLFFDAFSYAENQISRERELAADALAAHMQGSEPIATALVKLAAFSSIWDGVVQWTKEGNSEGTVRLGENSYEPRQFFSNMSQLFCAMVQDAVSPDRLKDLDLVKSSHPTDTHPPLSVRLNALNTSLTAMGHSALAVVIENPSSDLIDNVEALEVSLSDFQQRLACISHRR